MRFERLSLLNFRNISSQTLNLKPGLNVFRGQNGQGKTNLIESLCLLTSGKSFRTNRLEDYSNISKNLGFQIKAYVDKNDLKFTLEMGHYKGKKTLQINGKNIGTPRLKKSFPSLLFSPESLLIVKDSAQKRRDLIDSLCISLFPAYSRLLGDYRKALRQKNNLLKKLKEEAHKSSHWLKVNENLTEILFQLGSKISFYRIQGIEEISPLLLEEFLEIMDEHYGNICIKYLVSGEDFRGKNQAEILNAMYKRWKELKDREMASGLALVGPHKHDIQFDFGGQEARFFCSQGQQRAIILAFKMAQIRLHYRAHKEFPILLLDDVLSELDREKQLRFVNYLLSTEAQIFLTTTDAIDLPEMAVSSVFEVKDGVFSESERVLMGGLSV